MKVLLKQFYKGVSIEVSAEYDHRTNWNVRSETIKQFLALKRDMDYLIDGKKEVKDELTKNQQAAFNIDDISWDDLIKQIETAYPTK